MSEEELRQFYDSLSRQFALGGRIAQGVSAEHGYPKSIGMETYRLRARSYGPVIGYEIVDKDDTLVALDLWKDDKAIYQSSEYDLGVLAQVIGLPVRKIK